MRLFLTILEILFGVCFIFGLLVYPYCFHRRMVLYLASDGLNRKPVDLFFCAHLTALLSGSAFVVFAFITGLVLPGGGGILLLPLAGGGFILWKIAIFKSSSERAQKSAALQSCALINPQIWLQDILVCVLVFGTAMTLGLNTIRGENELVAIFSILELLSHLFALFIGMDVCRFCQFKSDQAGRAFFFFFCTAMAAVPLAIFIEIFAWMAWRNGMAHAALDTERRARHAQLCGIINEEPAKAPGK